MRCREVEGCRVGLVVDLLISFFCSGGVHSKVSSSALVLHAGGFHLVDEDMKRAMSLKDPLVRRNRQRPQEKGLVAPAEPTQIV